MNLEEIKRRVEAYQLWRNSSTPFTDNQIRRGTNIMVADGYNSSFSELAAHAVCDIPALISEVERLQAELEHAITLPYKIGDTVWVIMDSSAIYDRPNYFIDSFEVESIVYNEWEASPNTTVCVVTINEVYDANDCYPTREAAEAALAGMSEPDE